MTYAKFWLAYNAMVTIEAEESLSDIEKACAPHSKPEHLKKIESRYKSQARKHIETQTRTMTPLELAYGIAGKQLENGKREDRN